MNMKWLLQYKVTVLALTVALAGCDKAPPQTEAKAPVQETAAATNTQTALPADHPVIGGAKDNDPHAGMSIGGEPMKKRGEATVSVPESVAKRWKAVNVKVQVAGGENREMRVDVGGAINLDASGMTLQVGPFLPSYISDFNQITSASDNLENPAVMIALMKDGNEVEKGWVFRDLPDFNTFVNDVVKVQLISAAEQ